MDTEFEAKFYPVNKDKYRQKLLSLGAKLLMPERQFRRVVSDKRHNPQINCSYLRVRDEGDIIRLSAKVSGEINGSVGDQKELDIVVSDFDKTVELFQVMGFSLNNYQENLRETWELEGAEITIDTWPGLEPYSEIETSSEAEVRRLAEKLGFDWTKKIITPAAEIFSDRYHLPLNDVLQKLSRITFSENPFAALPVFDIPNSQLIS
jgi:adenylate cyclase, class 2